MRNTKQRSLVLEVVNHNDCHPTALEVYQECKKVIPNISLGTVYRNLNFLALQGEIQRVEVPGHIERYDKRHSHDHFICIKCGNIIDLKQRSILSRKMIKGNQILTFKTYYNGICHDCLKLEKESRNYGTKGK